MRFRGPCLPRPGTYWLLRFRGLGLPPLRTGRPGGLPSPAGRHPLRQPLQRKRNLFQDCSFPLLLEASGRHHVHTPLLRRSTRKRYPLHDLLHVLQPRHNRLLRCRRRGRSPHPVLVRAWARLLRHWEGRPLQKGTWPWRVGLGRRERHGVGGHRLLPPYYGTRRELLSQSQQSQSFLLPRLPAELLSQGRRGLRFLRRPERHPPKAALQHGGVVLRFSWLHGRGLRLHVGQSLLRLRRGENFQGARQGGASLRGSG